MDLLGKKSSKPKGKKKQKTKTNAMKIYSMLFPIPTHSLTMSIAFYEKLGFTVIHQGGFLSYIQHSYINEAATQRGDTCFMCVMKVISLSVYVFSINAWNHADLLLGKSATIIRDSISLLLDQTQHESTSYNVIISNYITHFTYTTWITHIF